LERRRLALESPVRYTARLRSGAVARTADEDQRVCRMAGASRTDTASDLLAAFVPHPKEGSDMALYEHMLIARQDISAQAVDALATHLKTIIETEGGKVEKQEYWGLRTLAYRIKKNRKGHYVLLNLSAPANAISELERQLKINEDVLRFLTVRVEAFEQSNSSRKREREAAGGETRRPREDSMAEIEGTVQ
jgi:small subunit ribosomal protein S6